LTPKEEPKKDDRRAIAAKPQKERDKKMKALAAPAEAPMTKLQARRHRCSGHG
jgi:hypothetical protein